MSKTIKDVFDLKPANELTSMGFVVRLREADRASEEFKNLVSDYVVTPSVEKELPLILDKMKQVYSRGEEYGRFIHGSFGSGKSHFMSMLAAVLENVPEAWAKFGPLLKKGEHQAWLEKAGLLVVRLHMLSTRGRTTGFDRAVYDAFNAALARRDKATFEFLNLDAVFAEARREAQEYGDVVWKKLESAGIVGSKEEFEAIAAGSITARESFAKAWLQHKGRNLADAGIDPKWSEGLKRMAAHAKAQGFGGIVLMVDEFVLWLAEKSGREFIQEINNLTMIVDHDKGQRAAPIFVFVARQRSLSEFFPDLADDKQIYEHINHQAQRFEVTNLEDVELRHIVRGRVLRPRDPKAIDAAVAALAEKHDKVWKALLANGDSAYLKDVYPFHPALIEMLVDVTSLMQRERSALRLLYELLVVHNPDLPLGAFIPVGSAFSAIFTRAGVEASKKIELMQEIHHAYYLRLEPTIDQLAVELGADFTPERKTALQHHVKTVLLGAVSTRLAGSGLTIERLVQLNTADVEGESFRTQVRIAQTDLRALSTRLPDLQIVGTDKTAQVTYVLGRVSLGEVLKRAQSKVDNLSTRFRTFWGALRKALDLDGAKGFEDGGPNEGDWTLLWRKTRRRGRIKLNNVREMSQQDFEPPEDAFAVLIDYPWDEPGRTVDEDRMRAVTARKKKGNLHTVCWLPRHFTDGELAIITELAAVRYLRSEAGQEDLLETFGKQDRTKLLENAVAREKMLADDLDALLLRVYVKEGEFFPLVNGVDSARPRETLFENLEHITAALMDRRYPQHPLFTAEPKKADLQCLLEWMLSAGEQGVSVAYDEETGRVLNALAKPLELVNVGQTKASLRLDSRYIKDVLQRSDADSVSWTAVAEHLREQYGFQPLLIELFLNFLCRRDHRAIDEATGETVEVGFNMSASQRLRLQRGKLLGSAEWGRVRDLGHVLFGLARPSVHRSLQSQDASARDLAEAGKARRGVLQSLHQRLVELGAEQGERVKELGVASQRLAALAQHTTDSFKVLSDLLTAWADEPADPFRIVVQQASSMLEAVTDLDRHSRTLIEGGRQHPTLAGEFSLHLGALNARLAARQVEQPLTREWVREWNEKARRLTRRLVEVVPPPPQGPGTATKVPPPLPAPARLMLRADVVPSDAASVDAFINTLRAELAKVEKKRITIVVGEGEA
ncbi:MAG: hypothetical protein K1X89_03920 [Myxococcaceae bacterium]|nr:hypothetical protein [Myxococcaceae bacterium]